jgi:hypothetical protein
MVIDHKTKALVFYLSRIQGLSIRQVAKECNVSTIISKINEHSMLPQPPQCCWLVIVRTVSGEFLLNFDFK